MAGPSTALLRHSTERMLARDRPIDLVAVLATFVAYVVLDRWTALIAVITEDDLGRFSLLGAAVANRWWLVVPFVIVAAAGLRHDARALLAPWSALQHGGALRLLTGVLVALLTWQAALYDVNFVAGRVHALDRLVVVGLAVAALYRPVAIVAFVLQVRIINEQFLHPFGTVAAKNVDELLLIALLAIAACHVIYVVTGRNDTSPVLLIIGAAVAAHFFWPGKAKLVSDWVNLTDISDLPLSSHSAGWLGSTDGGVARAMSGFFDFFRTPVLIGTLIIEVGALFAALHPKLLRLWIPGFVLFHAMTFITTGFFFLGWTLLELGLLAALSLPRFRDWVAANATPARGLVSVAAVVGGTILFHPPGLAWFDAPISYGYEIEAVGDSGAPYHVPISALAPLDQDVSFARLQLSDRLAASGGYGALGTAYELERLRGIDDFEALAAYEVELGDPPPTDRSQRYFLDFFDHVNDGRRLGWFGLGPPDRFWTSREDPVFDYEEPLQRLEVTLVASIHGDDAPISRRQVVLVIEADAEGRGVVVGQSLGG
ncbi:MAG: hypothetical protein OEV40_11185 [Acidimicrobiia bacterium]|nr:hypothetical protein [Acidimicrobiia bacterium]